MSCSLFNSGNIGDWLDRKRHKAITDVEELSAPQMNAATNDECVSNIVSLHRLDVLQVLTDKAVMSEADHKVDVSKDFERAIGDRSKPFMVSGVRISIRVPFQGDAELFRLRPTRYTTVFPRGIALQKAPHAGELLMAFDVADGELPERVRGRISEQLDLLTRYVEHVRADIGQYNAQLVGHVSTAVTTRRQSLLRRQELLESIPIPLERKNETVGVLPMPKRELVPMPAPIAVERDYTIGSDNYEYVLSVMRFQTRSFESTPRGFRKLNEEELRDVVLSSLNTHFKGDATGERFRRNGKTDICIQFENRAAFVAECKMWHGAKAASEAIDQLLSYSTWRDGHCAVVLFNSTVSGFKDLQDAMPSTISGNARFLSHLETTEAGEWRAKFRSAADEARVVTVHFFLVDLGSSYGPAESSSARSRSG